MFDIHVFKALATQTSIKIGQISFNVTTPLDLQHLDQGIQCAGVTMGHVLPRSAVSDETWSKILAQLPRRARMNQMQSQARVRGAASRLFHDLGFKIHFAVYVAVNALLIVINLVTTPGKYWFYWPLFGWGIGVAGHAFGVLRHSKISLSRYRAN